MHSDSELLHHFSQTGDESAFGELVGRHAPMMRGVALRTTGDPALADEVTQTVFAILARKAGSLQRVSIGGWLHRTTFLEARNAARKSARYRSLLKHYQDQTMTLTQTAGPQAKEILPHLDESMTQLSEQDRHLVVQRYFEDHSIQEIAAELGTTEETCRKRIQRSVHRLGDQLRLRGVGATTAGLATFLTAQNLCAPTAVASVIATTALKSASVMPTAKLWTYTILLMKTSNLIKLSAVIAVIALVSTAVIWNQSRQTPVKEETPQRTLSPAPSTKAHSKARQQAAPVEPTLPQTTQPVKPEGSLTAETAFMIQMMQAEADMAATQMYTQLCSTITDLTEEQKIKLRTKLENSVAEQLSITKKLMLSGAAERLSDPDTLTEEDKKLLDMSEAGMVNLDDKLLKDVLSPEQYTRYEDVLQARRVNQAEYFANDTLREVERYIPLTQEQKDALFQKLANRRLNPDDRLSALGSNEELKDAMVRSELTQEQRQLYDQARKREAESQEKLKALEPKP